MKRFFLLCLCAISALASDRITAVLTITNTPIAAQTLQVNSETVTWVNSISVPAVEVLVTNSIAASTTNLWRSVTSYPLTHIAPSWVSTSSLRFAGQTGDALTVAATGWGSVTYSTQTVSSLTGIRVPMSAEVEPVRTNNATLLVVGISDYAQEPFDEDATAMDNFVGLTSSQTISGTKVFSGTTTFADITTTNLVNHGNAMSSPGTGTSSEQFGTGATATNLLGLAVGNSATASGTSSTALGYNAQASAASTLAVGSGSEASGSHAVAIGSTATASGDYSIALGQASQASYDQSVAIGYNAATTADNQIMIGDSGNDTLIPGDLTVLGYLTGTSIRGNVGALTNGTWSAGTLTSPTITKGSYSGTLGAVTNGVAQSLISIDQTATNFTAVGTNRFVGSTAWTVVESDSLASGNNAGVDFENATVSVIRSGPSASFAICGVAGGSNGRVITILNSTGYTMTIANDSGVDPTAANRIYTGTGTDMPIVGTGTVTICYDSTSSRWRVVAATQSSTFAAATVTGLLTVSNITYSGTYWDDVTSPGLNLKGIAADPDEIPLNTGGSTTNTVIHAFDATSVEEGYVVVQLPHRYKEGTAIYPHVHWVQTDAPSGSNTNVVWGLEYTIAAPYTVFPATTTIYCTNGVSTTNWFHQVSAFPAISGSGLTVSSILNARIFRAATSASDTYGSDAGYLYFDVHHEVDSPGSRSEYTK